MVVFGISPMAWTEGNESASLSVAEAVICQEILDRQPVSGGTSFPASTGRLWCFTRIQGAQSPTEVTHVWYYGEVERFRIGLAINSTDWRTYSAKRIQPHETGSWRVDVLGPDNSLLTSVLFQIAP
jgi:hypothetical protein